MDEVVAQWANGKTGETAWLWHLDNGKYRIVIVFAPNNRPMTLRGAQTALTKRGFKEMIALPTKEMPINEYLKLTVDTGPLAPDAP